MLDQSPLTSAKAAEPQTGTEHTASLLSLSEPSSALESLQYSGLTIPPDKIPSYIENVLRAEDQCVTRLGVQRIQRSLMERIEETPDGGLPALRVITHMESMGYSLNSLQKALELHSSPAALEAELPIERWERVRLERARAVRLPDDATATQIRSEEILKEFCELFERELDQKIQEMITNTVDISYPPRSLLGPIPPGVMEHAFESRFAPSFWGVIRAVVTHEADRCDWFRPDCARPKSPAVIALIETAAAKGVMPEFSVKLSNSDMHAYGTSYLSVALRFTKN